MVFEWVGGFIVTQDLRKPIDEKLLKYGKLVFHFAFYIYQFNFYGRSLCMLNFA